MNKDLSIIAQNAGTTAGNIVSALIASGKVEGFDADLYNEIRREVFNGSLDLAGAESVVVAFEGGGSTSSAGGSDYVTTSTGGSAPHADFEINSGKHRGKTLAAIDREDRSWLEWAADKLNNDYARKRIVEYVRATAA